MALTKVLGPGIHTESNILSHNINSSGIITATKFVGPIENTSGISTYYDLRVTNNLTVDGTTTTLDTDLVGVDRIEVGADSNSIVGVAITQSGTADIVNLFDGSTEVLTVINGGNVGIGTITPTAPLQINHASPKIILEDNDNAADVSIANVGGAAVYSSASDVVFQTADTSEKVRITSGGNLGIATVTPNATLDIHGANSNAMLRLTESAYTNTNKFTKIFEYGGTTYFQSRNDTNNGAFVFRGENNSTTPEFLRITSAGKVGIGTDNPASLLHLWASAPRITLTDTAGTDDTAKIFSTGGILYLQQRNDSAHGQFIFRTENDTTAVERFTINSSGVKTIKNGNLNINSAYIDFSGDVTTPATAAAIYRPADNTLAFSTANVERLSINSTGISTFKGDITLEAAGANRISMRHTSGGAAVIKNPTAANLSFGTNNQDNELTIKNGGNIGIGSEIPAEKLDVAGTIQCLNELRSKSGNDLLLNAGSANRDVKIQVNDVNMLYVKGDTGKVGINTDNPGSFLEIYNSDTAGNTQLHIHNDKTGDAAVLKLEGGRTSINDCAQIVFANTGDNVAVIQAFSADDDGALVFKTSATESGSAVTEALRITGDGLVQIDTVSVNTGTNGVNAKLQIDSSSQYDGILLGNTATYGTISRGASNGALVYTANAAPANLGGGDPVTHEWWSGTGGGGGPSRLMVLTAGGNVGVGTTNPNATLDIVSNEAAGYIASFRQRHTSNYATILIDSPSDNNTRPSFIDLACAGNLHWSFGQAYSAHVNNTFHFSTSDLGAGETGSKLAITKAGNVGIGTVTPGEKLDVDGSIRLRAGGNWTTYATRLTSRLDSTHMMSLEAYHNSSTPVEVLGTYADSGGSNVRTVIAAGGMNVGIGSDNPENKLKINVAGSNDGVVVQNTSTDKIAMYGARNGDATLQIGQFGSTASGTTFGIANANLAFIYTTSYASTHPSALLIGNNAAKDIIFATTATERLRITSGGDVSISSDGSVHGISKLTIKPANRTTAFDASDGDTWHDVVIKHEGDAANNAVGLAFEVSPSDYHTNAGTGIAAVKNGTGSDYGSDLAFITRGQSVAASEKLRITSDGRVIIGTTSQTQGQLGILNTNDFSTASVSTNTDNLWLISDATSGDGVYGASIGFSRVQYADRRAAAIATIQEGSDEDRVGLAFFTHPGDNATDPVVEKLRISHNGRLLIGTQKTYGSASYYDDITINNSNGSGESGGTGITLISSTDSWNSIYFGDSDNHGIGGVKYDHNTDHMRFVVNGIDPAVVINSSGQLIIGDDHTTANAHANADDLIVGNTSADKRSGITIVSDTDQDGQIHFSRGTGTNNLNIKGQIVYSHATGNDSNKDSLGFYCSASEVFRVYGMEEEYGADDFVASTSSGAQNTSQATPRGALQWENKGEAAQELKFKSWMQSSGANDGALYLTVKNSGFYRITVKASHNSTQADCGMWLVYGLNSQVATNKVVEVCSSGNFTVTATLNTHINSHDSTIKIDYGTSCNQGLRALIELIGGF